MLTGDRYNLRLWTPRTADADASEPEVSEDRGRAPVDLLSLISPKNHYEKGIWQIAGGELISPTTNGARFEIPYHPPSEYRGDMEVERIAPDPPYGFGLIIAVGGRQAELIVDRKGEHDVRESGLQGFDGIPVSYSPYVHRR